MTLSPDDLAAMKANHQPWEPSTTVCGECDQLWPCDSRRLLDEVEATTCTGCGHPWRGSDHGYGKRSCCPDCSHFDSAEEVKPPRGDDDA